MIENERMLNGKRFGDCSRMELFDMLMSMIKQVRDLHMENTKLKNDTLKNRVVGWFKGIVSKFKR